jgi:hypothetical protein
VGLCSESQFERHLKQAFVVQKLVGVQGPAPPGDMVQLASQGAWCRVGLRRGSGCGWLNEELTNVALGPVNFVRCFWVGVSIGRRDHVDLGCLVVGLLVGLIGQWEVEEAFVETI